MKSEIHLHMKTFNLILCWKFCTGSYDSHRLTTAITKWSRYKVLPSWSAFQLVVFTSSQKLWLVGNYYKVYTQNVIIGKDPQSRYASWINFAVSAFCKVKSKINRNLSSQKRNYSRTKLRHYLTPQCKNLLQ